MNKRLSILVAFIVSTPLSASAPATPAPASATPVMQASTPELADDVYKADTQKLAALKTQQDSDKKALHNSKKQRNANLTKKQSDEVAALQKQQASDLQILQNNKASADQIKKLNNQYNYQFWVLAKDHQGAWKTMNSTYHKEVSDLLSKQRDAIQAL